LSSVIAMLTMDNWSRRDLFQDFFGAQKFSN
jgi:hypothetical protein